jgi:hypothetical protein
MRRRLLKLKKRLGSIDMVERDKSHDEELVRWAEYVRENPDKWKAKLKPFLDSQIIIARRFRKENLV